MQSGQKDAWKRAQTMVLSLRSDMIEFDANEDVGRPHIARYSFIPI